jgi:hypothetical protein
MIVFIFRIIILLILLGFTLVIGIETGKSTYGDMKYKETRTEDSNKWSIFRDANVWDNYSIDKVYESHDLSKVGI